LLRYAAGIEPKFDFSATRFRTSASIFLEALVKQLLNITVEERPSAKTLLEKLPDMPPISSKSSKLPFNTALNPPSKSHAFDYVVSDDDEFRHIRMIATGGYGEVHEVRLSGFLD
jgi:hypothetical protein